MPSLLSKQNSTNRSISHWKENTWRLELSVGIRWATRMFNLQIWDHSTIETKRKPSKSLLDRKESRQKRNCMRSNLREDNISLSGPNHQISAIETEETMPFLTLSSAYKEFNKKKIKTFLSCVLWCSTFDSPYFKQYMTKILLMFIRSFYR